MHVKAVVPGQWVLVNESERDFKAVGYMQCTPLEQKRGLSRLSENAKFKKSGIDIKGLMTREFAKIPILEQPVSSWQIRTSRK